MTSRQTCRRGDATLGERGQVTAFVAAFLGALALLAGLVLDGGLALAGRVRAIDEAQEAARAAAQQLDLAAYRAHGAVTLVPERAAAAARAYLAAVGDTGAVLVAGDHVTVTVRHTQPTQILRAAGLRAITVSGAATAHAERGVQSGEDAPAAPHADPSPHPRAAS